MWFFRSIELLPRPRFLGLAPTLAMLAVWAVFEGTTPALFGHPVQPLWLAFVTFFALTLAARLPQLLARAEGRGNGRVALILSAVAIALLVGAGGLVTETYSLQIGWILCWLGYSGLFVLLLATSDPGELAAFPYRWASDHPFSREAMWIVALRLATVALAAALVAIHGTLTEWVVTITLGRLALFYLFEWVTILCALTWRDRDG